MKNYRLLILFLLIGACGSEREAARERFASKNAHCVEGGARGTALCKVRGGDAYVCFADSGNNPKMAYCIRAVDPLDLRPEPTTAEARP